MKVVNVISIPSQLFRRLFSPPPFSNQTFPTEGSLGETGRQVDGNLLLPGVPILAIGGLVIVCPYLDLTTTAARFNDNEHASRLNAIPSLQ